MHPFSANQCGIQETGEGDNTISAKLTGTTSQPQSAQ